MCCVVEEYTVPIEVLRQLNVLLGTSNSFIVHHITYLSCVFDEDCIVQSLMVYCIAGTVRCIRIRKHQPRCVAVTACLCVVCCVCVLCVVCCVCCVLCVAVCVVCCVLQCVLCVVCVCVLCVAV